MTRTNQLESSIERRYSEKIKEAGWFVTKLIKTSTNGIPDRLCIKNGRVVFIEFKIPGEKSTPLQVYVQGKIKEQMIEVIQASCLNDIKHLL